jgi:signal transduction histidine kinase
MPLESEAAALRDLEGTREAITSLRAALDAGMAAPSQIERAAAGTRFFDGLSLEITRLNRLAVQLGTHASSNANPLARNLLEITRLTSSMFSLAGQRAIRIDSLVATGGRNSADTIEQSDDLTGRLDETWQRIQELAVLVGKMRPSLDTSEGRDIAGAIRTVRRGYIESVGQFYDGIIDAVRKGVSPGVTPQEVIQRHAPGFVAITDLCDAAVAEAVAITTQAQDVARLRLILTVGLLLLVAAIAAFSVLVLQRRVLAPISMLTRTVFRLADNDRNLEVPELARHDEVGDLARAIETLRGNAEHAAGLERERQSMEVQLRQAQKLEALGTLAGGIAHEINTPAQYVGDNMRFLQTSFAEYGRVLAAYVALGRAAGAEPALHPLAAAAKDAEAAADLDFLTAEIPTAIAQSLDGIDRIRQIVLAVKEFSHPDVKEVAPLDLNHAIDTTITVTRNQWKYIAEMATDLALDLPEVPCRGGEINQMLLNLIVNAAHAIEAKGQGTGTITVATARRDGWAEIRVSDTGTGIPPALIDRIFDPFFTTKEPGKGTGQGLAICHNIVVTKHGGSIAVESTLGEGSCFIVRLPFEPPAMPVDLGIAA